MAVPIRVEHQAAAPLPPRFMADDYYAILGVSNEASSNDIKRRFRQIAMECHPDRPGSDDASEARFKKARKAYETLMDPVTRARYDRRGQRRLRPGENFFDAFYRHTGGDNSSGGVAGAANSSEPSTAQRQAQTRARSAAGGPSGRKPRKHDPGNDVGLDDLFNDFGFGGRSKPTERSKGAPHSSQRSSQRAAPSGVPSPGTDVMIELDVPSTTASVGGSVTAVYHRMQRADSWRPGMGDPGLVRVQDIADIRVIPGTRTGEVLREKGLGHAGAHGGPYGDLVVRVRLTGARAPRPTPQPTQRSTARTSPADGAQPGPQADGARSSTVGTGSQRAFQGGAEASPEHGRSTHFLEISVVEAMLGGRVPLETEQGSVRLSVAPGSSGGTKLRLKGKGPVGADGQPSDLYVTLRILVPKTLDGESRQLIERFAALNPD